MSSLLFILFLFSNQISNEVYIEYMSFGKEFDEEMLVTNEILVGYGFENWKKYKKTYKQIAQNESHVLYPLAIFRLAQCDYKKGKVASFESKFEEIIHLKYEENWRNIIPEMYYNGKLGENEYSRNLFTLKKIVSYYFINKHKRQGDWGQVCYYYDLITKKLLGEFTVFNTRNYKVGYCHSPTIKIFMFGMDNRKFEFNEEIVKAHCFLEKGEIKKLKNVISKFITNRANQFPQNIDVSEEVENILSRMVATKVLDKKSFKKNLDKELSSFQATAKPHKGYWYSHHVLVDGIRIKLETYAVFDRYTDEEIEQIQNKSEKQTEVKSKSQLVEEFKSTYFYRYFE